MNNEPTNHSEQINELAAALAAAQGSFQSIKRSKAVEVSGTTKDGKPYRYKYAYAPLDEILNATRPALSQNGLAIIQTTNEGDGRTLLKTSLIHASGQWVESYKDLGRFDKPQEFGGALTYYRRYQISAILGISSEEDDDANGVTGNETQPKQKPASRPTVDQSTGEVMPAKKAQTNGTSAKPAEATAKVPAPTNDQELLEMVNNRVLVTYGNVHHLRNAIRQELENSAWDWPAKGDRSGWGEAYAMAKRHADGKTTEKAPVVAEEEPAF